MKYETTPVNKTVSKTAISKHKDTTLADVNTSSIVWHLIKRHKFGLVVAYAVVISVYYFVPFAPDVLLSLI